MAQRRCGSRHNQHLTLRLLSPHVLCRDTNGNKYNIDFSYYQNPTSGHAYMLYHTLPGSSNHYAAVTGLAGMTCAFY